MNKKQRDALRAKIAADKQRKYESSQRAQPGISSVSSPVLAQPKSLEEIVHACGHKQKVESLEAMKCPECRSQHRQNKARERSEKRSQNQAKIVNHASRLPNGSVYSKVYDGDSQQWTVSLSVIVDGEPRVFEAKGSSSIKTEIACDRLYREAAGLDKPVQPGIDEAASPQ